MPAWSPDGQRIAFSSDQAGDYDIWVMNADGSNPTRVTDDSNVQPDDGGDIQPRWSPDGAKIIYTRTGSSGVFVIAADGSGRERFADNTPRYFADWSSDGTRIAYTSFHDGNGGYFGNGELYVIGANGLGPKRLTNDRAEEFDANWSPDGTWLAFTRFGMVSQIVLLNPDDTTEMPLTGAGTVAAYPAWSPDGSQVAYQAELDGGRSQIYVADASGSTATPITMGFVRDAQANWQPVNRPPTCDAVTVLTSAGAAAEITVAGADSDRETLTFTAVTQPAGGSLSPVKQPEPALSGTYFDAASERQTAFLTYTPREGFSGPDEFVFRAEDHRGGTCEETATLEVTPSDDGPANVNPPTGGTQPPEPPPSTGESQPPEPPPFIEGAQPFGDRPTVMNAHMLRDRIAWHRVSPSSKIGRRSAFVFTLAGPAQVMIAIERIATGRLVADGSCRQRTRRNRRAKSCARPVSAGPALGSSGTQGRNAVPFSGRVGRRWLRPAKYRAAITATNANGASSVPVVVKFRIVRP